MAEKDLKQMYRTRTEGDFPKFVEVLGRKYIKTENLRYGTNPHQPAAFYRPMEAENLVLGAYEILKSGKSGLSQTNIEDMHHAIGILKFMQRPACAVMKHCNPSGAAIQKQDMPLVEVYQRARDADAQAAFGSVVVFNTVVDADTATEIMQTIVEGVAAPGYAPEALEVFNNSEKFRRNKEIRIIRIPNPASLPKFIDDGTDVREIKMFDDGSMVVAVPYLSRVKNVADLALAYNEHKTKGRIDIARKPTAQELDDLLFAWYVNIHVRSNGCVVAKNGQTICVGTGEQDRVGAVQQALVKAKEKYKGTESLEGAVMSSDGFFPFRDAVDAATSQGVRAIVQPGGSVNDYEAIEACNEVGATMVFAMERCFSHH
ncbi:MAG: phosphoribosylaminoimidazolecarboxamide formyltransferase / cyclohydrolase [Candidatus Hydrogenedentes bacterium]|nr:phosphoribosylaminoimidazolecarboxamide formyltransferase / cyclohydrolase [Candidatus Hydrogenedentota bacterium]